MFKVLTKDFIKNPVLEMDVTAPTDEIELYGKKYRMYADDWKKHIHLKCTNMCDANCDFCIERASRHELGNCHDFLTSMKEVVYQMQDQGHFRTLSVTGGEPTAFGYLQSIVNFANSVRPMLFSINSNGYDLESMERDTFDGWFNLSKHAIDDSRIFHRGKNVTPAALEMFKILQPRAHIRIQCVLGMKEGLRNLNDILRFIQYFKGHVDNYSFRSLILDNDYDKIPQLFTDLRNYLFDHMVEQAIQDYYVYEIYDLHGTSITLSWSNMFLLKQYNETHRDENFLEEIIVHPDGMVTGSWDKRTLIIKDLPR